MSCGVLLKNVVASGVGEGPVWDERKQCLYFVDILPNGKIFRWQYGQKAYSSATLLEHSMIGFAIPCKTNANALIVGAERDLLLYDWTTQGIDKIAEVELRGTKNRFNDGKCDPQGRLWAGTMGHQPKPLHLELKMGSLYCLDDKKQLRDALKPFDLSNGLAWTKDSRRMFFIDTIPKKLYVFDFDAQNGTASNQKVAIDFSSLAPEKGFPDGMTIDTDGKLWICFYAGARVAQFDPETGKQLREIAVEARGTTSCAFGGPNLDELFVTTASLGMTDDDWKAYPNAGSLFKVTGLGAKGLSADFYAGC